MSFDVFFQSFDDTHDLDAFMTVLQPHIAASDGGFRHLVLADGEADLYARDDSVMANHISGTDAWDLLVTAARAADLVILPLVDDICLTRESQRPTLPEELQSSAELVTSGADLLRVITRS